MRIAVATVDGISLSQHFGQSSGFVVFDVKQNDVLTRELRSSSSSIHDLMHCDPNSTEKKSLPELIGDCEVVLVGGIGAGAVEKLKAAGKRTIVISSSGTVEDALASFLSGGALREGVSTCNCHH